MRFNEIHAANNKEYVPFLKLLGSHGLNPFPKPSLSRNEKIRHIRVRDSDEKMLSVLKTLPGVEVKKSNKRLSSSYDTFEVKFPEDYEIEDLRGNEFYILPAPRGRKVRKKEFTPVNLGLVGQTYSRDSLHNKLKVAIEDKVKDTSLKGLLLELIEVAVGKLKNVDPEIMGAFEKQDLVQLGQDFGEILGPLMSDSKSIIFPAGNSMLSDVEIDGDPISIKSGAGSGTSFKAILSHLDKFKEAGYDDLDDEEKAVYDFYRAFIDTEGTNRDKLIAGSLVAQTDEHKALVAVIGKDNFTESDLEAFADEFEHSENGYRAFLNEIYPVANAGPYSRPNGLPQDSYYYMELKTVKPMAKQAGYPNWKGRGPAEAGRNIILYILATSFLKAVKDEKVVQVHNRVLSKIMKNVGAKLMWVDINPNGTLKMIVKDITDAKISFQYHAPSHIPGNNAPGFSLKLD